MLPWPRKTTIAGLIGNHAYVAGRKMLHEFSLLNAASADDVSDDVIFVDSFSQGLRKTDTASKQLTLLMSPHYVRYCTAPWVEGMSSHAELQSYAEYYARTIFGEKIAACELRYSYQGVDRPIAISIIDHTVIHRVTNAVTRAGFSLTSLMPDTTVYLQSGAKFTQGVKTYHLVTLYDDLLLNVRVVDGAIYSMSKLRHEGDWLGPVKSLIRRERLEFEIKDEDDKLFLFSVGQRATERMGTTLPAGFQSWAKLAQNGSVESQFAMKVHHGTLAKS